MPFRDVNKGKEVEEEEYIVLEIWTSQFNIINHYNSCRKQGINELKQIQGQIRNHIFRWGDFNSHSTLWGGRKTDTHGEIIEQLLEDSNLICFNDGRGTRIDVHTGNTSALDLTLVSSEVAWTCEWEVWEDSTIGSDHHPIFSNIHIGWEAEEREVQSVRWEKKEAWILQYYNQKRKNRL